jgi:exosortase A
MAPRAAANPYAWLRPAAPALGLGLLVLALFFHTEASAAVSVWNSSTAYGHCWLVLPIAAWMAYERRFQAAAVAMRPASWPALLAPPLVVMWLGADLVGVMEGRQFAAIGLLELLLLAVFGWRLWQALAAAFVYLVFLVPFGAFLTPMLQDFTAAFVAHGLDFLNIPGEVTAYRIEIPEGSFYVAEACAGLRFLIASVAFGVLYALTMFQTPWRRAAFILASIVVPIIANGFRALGIVVLGHVLGSAEAAATDHLLYGWIFFSLVILLLAASGMPFRQDPPAAPRSGPAPPPGTPMRAMLAAWPVLLVAAIGPAAGLWLDHFAGRPTNAVSVMKTPDGCLRAGTDSAGAVLTETFRCGDATITARLEMLPPRANPARVVAAAQTEAGALLPGKNIDGGMLQVNGTTPARWILQRDEDHPAAAAYALFIDGEPALGGLRDRLHLARDLLFGAPSAPAVLVVAVSGTHLDPHEALEAFLAGQGNLAARVGK